MEEEEEEDMDISIGIGIGISIDNKVRAERTVFSLTLTHLEKAEFAQFELRRRGGLEAPAVFR